MFVVWENFLERLHMIAGNLLVKFSEETSMESKLEFSEDEETLIIRMYNLVGERY